MFVYTGDYFKRQNNITKTIYYTFTPRPLSENNFYSPDDEFNDLLINAYKELGILEGMSLYFPNQDIFQEFMLLKESYYSHRIDYADIDFILLLTDRGTGKNTEKIQNIISAYELAFTKKIILMDFNIICSAAIYGSKSKQKVFIRNEPLFFYKTMTNLRQYNPTAPEQINAALKDMTQFFNDDKTNVLIKAALLHYQFEMIHPFLSFNGIVGRILIYKILYDAQLNAVRYMSLSEYLYHNKDEYFEKLSSTQKDGNYLRWIKFILNAITKSAKYSIEQINDYEKIIKKDEVKINACAETTVKTIEVYHYFKKYLFSNVKHLSDELHIAYNTASTAIQLLLSLGILEQSSTGSRNRIFVYSELSNLFLNA